MAIDVSEIKPIGIDVGDLQPVGIDVGELAEPTPTKKPTKWSEFPETVGQVMGPLASIPLTFPGGGIAGAFEFAGKSIGNIGAAIAEGGSIYDAVGSAADEATKTIHGISAIPGQAFMGEQGTLPIYDFTRGQGATEAAKQVFGTVTTPFEWLAELNRKISGADNEGEPSAIRYALGAVPESLAYTVGGALLGKGGMKALTTKPRAERFKTQTEIAEKVGVPEAAPSAGGLKIAEVAKPVSPIVEKDRRRREVAAEKKQERMFIDDLQKQRETAENDLIVIEEPSVKVEEAKIEAKPEAIKVIGREGSITAEDLNPTGIGKELTPKRSVQKMNKAGLTEAETAELAAEFGVSDVPLADVKKRGLEIYSESKKSKDIFDTLDDRDTGILSLYDILSLSKEKQRERYESWKGITTAEEVPITPESKTRAEAIGKTVELHMNKRASRIADIETLKKSGYSEDEIAGMEDAYITKRAKNARGGINEGGVTEADVSKLTEIELKTRELALEAREKSVEDMTPEELASLETRLAEVLKDTDGDVSEVFDPLTRKSPLDMVDANGDPIYPTLDSLKADRARIVAGLKGAAEKKAELSKVDQRRRKKATEILEEETPEEMSPLDQVYEDVRSSRQR
jgi:CBS domain-containing protein